VCALTQSLAREPRYGYTVVGACVPGGARMDSIDVPQVGRLPIYGDENDIAHAVAASHADTVALTAAERLGPEGIRDLSWALEKLNVDLVVSPGVTDVANPRIVMRAVAGLPLLHLEKPQYNGATRLKKRVFDVCFSIVVLALAAPAMIPFAIAIKLTSRGPLFYMSERVGLEGRRFRMIKFRTMVVGADKRLDGLLGLNESQGGVLFKIRNDPRVTPVGRFLRRFSLDEMPQFINVLRGDMSVVGPRPPLPREVAKYDYSVRRRLLVLPGITGLWQISGRSDLSWEDSVRLDLSYVENWTMISDLLIAIKTLFVVLRGSGAY
jgi:exopolysaccharide biosynthesis polyprenyl glycosylphosphotransferase